MAKIQVMLVDDHAILREGLKALLALADDIQVVAEAGNGLDAITCLERCAVDIVVMDIAMPEMDGMEATRLILQAHPRTKVLVLSQHENERYALSVLQAGAMGYVLKRSAGEELVTAIRALQRGESYFEPAISRLVFHDLRHDDGADSAPEYGLTLREKQVLKLVAEGRASQEIADLLSLSKKTVLCHRANIYEKLGTHNRTELIRCAVRLDSFRSRLDRPVGLDFAPQFASERDGSTAGYLRKIDTSTDCQANPRTV